MSRRDEWPDHPDTRRWLKDIARLLASAEREHREVSAEVSAVEFTRDDTSGSLPDQEVEVSLTIHAKPGYARREP